MTEDEFINRLHDRVAQPWLCYAVIAICVLCFGVELVRSPSWWNIPQQTLLPMGANNGVLVQQGEYWRLITSIFLHGSPLHLGLNMLALWQVAQIVERIFGRGHTLLLWLGTGLCGSLASLWWKADGLSVGASGAIFGLVGALLAWLLIRRGDVPLSILKPLRSGTLSFIGYSLFGGFVIPGVDNAAHLGGLLSGLVLGAGLAAPIDLPATRQWRKLAPWLACLLTIVAGTLLWRSAPPVAKQWEAHVEFAQIEHAFAIQDATLHQQIATLMNEVQTRRVKPQEAARQIDEDLLPTLSAQIDRLATEHPPQRDESLHRALMRYASLRYDALQFLARALRTGQAHWLKLANERQQQAEAALLGTHQAPAR